MTTAQRFGPWISIFLLLLVVALNGALTLHNLHRIRAAEERQQSSIVFAAQTRQLLIDALDLEAGQRGYLLTDDPSYLQPYRTAKGRVPSDLADLRASLAHGHYKNTAGELESLFTAKIADADQTIALREKGYRLRAFVQVNNNDGKRLMDQIRTELGSLASVNDRNAAAGDVKEAVEDAIGVAVLSNAICLLFAALILALMYVLNGYLRREISGQQELVQRLDSRWSHLREVISQETLDLLADLSATAKQLFERYGDFLPQRGQEQTEKLRVTAEHAQRSLQQALHLDA